MKRLGFDFRVLCSLGLSGGVLLVELWGLLLVLGGEAVLLSSELKSESCSEEVAVSFSFPRTLTLMVSRSLTTIGELLFT